MPNSVKNILQMEDARQQREAYAFADHPPRKRPMKILCLHGVNTDENDTPAEPYWFSRWQQALTSVLPKDLAPPEFCEYRYNHYFNKEHASVGNYFGALFDAFKSAISRDSARGRGAAEDANPGAASMVAKWLEKPTLRAELRKNLAALIAKENPDIICAHSMGSLILYDTLIDADSRDSGKDRIVVTFGSQIGYPAVKQVFQNYLSPPSGLRQWFHFHNEYDLVLADRKLPLPPEVVTQIDTPFQDRSSLAGLINHDAVLYITAEPAVRYCWEGFAAASAKARGQAAAQWTFKAPKQSRPVQSHKHRALLIGIDNYPDEKNRLAGCINDVYSMSATLQERGFSPDAIRVVTDERATRQGVLERLQWLLEGVRSGDERFLYFSGHGARLTQYNNDGEPDHHDEALVTWDFDWKGNCGITDKELAAAYANLPYGAHLWVVLDCCHSGGMARGGGVTVRGLEPPDDVRHRAIRWDKKSGLWVQRTLNLSRKLMKSKTPHADAARYLGQDLSTHRMGRAVSLWSPESPAASAERKRMGHSGPFNPVMVASCGEGEYAYEYTHGAQAHGAFTFIFSDLLRRGDPGQPLAKLIAEVGRKMQTLLQLKQHPELYAPGDKGKAAFPHVPVKGA